MNHLQLIKAVQPDVPTHEVVPKDDILVVHHKVSVFLADELRMVLGEEQKLLLHLLLLSSDTERLSKSLRLA